MYFMGNQASKAAAEKKRRHRRSTLTTQSHMSQGNYNWLEENEHTALSAGAISEAMAAAAVSSVPQEPPRRKSITEFFTKRKQAVDFREYDRLQRQVLNYDYNGPNHYNHRMLKSLYCL